MTGVKVIIILSGKRKSGKDYVAELLHTKYLSFSNCASSVLSRAGSYKHRKGPQGTWKTLCGPLRSLVVHSGFFQVHCGVFQVPCGSLRFLAMFIVTQPRTSSLHIPVKNCILYRQR